MKLSGSSVTIIVDCSNDLLKIMKYALPFHPLFLFSFIYVLTPFAQKVELSQNCKTNEHKMPATLRVMVTFR